MHTLIGRCGVALTILMITITVLITSCTQDPSAQYFPAMPAHESPPASLGDQSAFDKNAGAMASRLHGAVARPDPKFTPGVVADSDLTSVCHRPKRLQGVFTPGSPLVSPADQQVIFDEYRIPAANIRHYGFDFLVPLQLGGARVRENTWPMATHGVGFHEKQVLNIRLHELVCRRELALDQAQKAVAGDWIKLWLVYG
jgi:hypothetical protein